ncbi:aminotransferase class V-fold PLP-dependent enzyme [Elioraea rosea]|uniref:aminotransferase class V-fold PLP-dependent enzyme n=1 Tax=Elioraea rosea TaxID=2492390 RepID=UPI0013154311|nr:aminotransferase class V-fold PLP-dependent enzyme [Elioraea rosea]
MTIGEFSHLFEVPGHIAYFNTAYNAPLLRASRQALEVAAGLKSRPWERMPEHFFQDAEAIRQHCSSLFGGVPDNFAIIPAASYGVSTAARIIEPRLRRGDIILMLEQEFPSNVLPWLRVAAERDAEIVRVERPEDGNWTQAVLDRLESRARVASLPACHWTDGAQLDLAAISRACRSRDVVLSLDVTQSLGAVPIDLADVRPDFMVAAGYKWLLCPYGASFFYVDSRWHGARPLEEGWLTRAGSENFAGLVEYQENYRAGARRFDVGETCVTTLLPGAIEALTQIERWGIAKITGELDKITGRIERAVEDLGYGVLARDHRSPHILGLTCKEPQRLIGLLRANNVYVSQRGEAVRIAPHLHITEANIERLIESFHQAVSVAR